MGQSTGTTTTTVPSSTKTTSAPASTGTPSSGLCAGVTAWSSSAVYTGGMTATYSEFYERFTMGILPHCV
jgi:chitinase